MHIYSWSYPKCIPNNTAIGNREGYKLWGTGNRLQLPLDSEGIKISFGVGMGTILTCNHSKALCPLRDEDILQIEIVFSFEKN